MSIKEKVPSVEKCREDASLPENFRGRLPEKTEKIIASCRDHTLYNHIDYDPLPSRVAIIQIIDKLKEVLFPGYFNTGRLDPANLKYNIGQTVSDLYDLLSEQITNSIRHECVRYGQECSRCGEQGNNIALQLLDAIPRIRKKLSKDILATLEGDPAAGNPDEIIFSYPGLFATAVYRVAHKLVDLETPLIPRIMTEHAHSVTGIDIHPGAHIGERFVIDHGTGVVIGETTEIGNNVRIYQGVTLGALSLAKDDCEKLRGKKRHPTIKDHVIIYSGATILGGETVIGKSSVIGGNVWLTNSVPEDTKVFLADPRLVYK